MEPHIHWMAISFFVGFEEFEKLIYKPFFEVFYGPLVDVKHGGRGYRELYNAIAGVQVYACPIGEAAQDNVHLVIPGNACEAIAPVKLNNLADKLYVEGIRWHFTRIDLAVDRCPFSVEQFKEAVLTDRLISLAKRHTFKEVNNPFEYQENGGPLGCHTVYLGSRTAERMVRVYDQHGFTRLELECHGDRAKLVGLDLAEARYQDWLKKFMAHIRQYIELDTDWWREFCQGTTRGDMKISSVRALVVAKVDKWLKKQVAAAVYVLHELSGEIYSDDLIQEGKQVIERNRLRYGRSRYDALLQMAGA